MLKATATVSIEHDENGAHLLVSTRWSGEPLDREVGIGFTLPVAKRPLASRLANAIDGGAVFRRPVVRRDVHGKTYVSADVMVRGRTMAADLRRLGF